MTHKDLSVIRLSPKQHKNMFAKSHGLGNEYIVLDEENITFELNEIAIKKLCNVNFGIGSDGILLKVNSKNADIGLRIFNPDGSEAEKSGNGLRILCKYVYDYGIINKKTFTVETMGGIVKADIKEVANGKAKIVTVDIGKAIFNSALIPTKYEKEEVQDELILIDDKEYKINCVSVGNPHCVILKKNLDIEEIKKYGPEIENHHMFPNRINVQFAKVINRKEVEVLIWERGAGFTLASGSSSCAVACIMRKKGLVENELTIKMPGGELKIQIDDNWDIRMTGKVRQICEGILSDELLEDL